VSDIDNIPDFEEKVDDYIVLKGRLKALDTNTFGLFILFFNEDHRVVESLIAIASHYSSLYENDPHLPWYAFEENIINIKWKGDFAVNISQDFQHYMENAFDVDGSGELVTMLYNTDTVNLENMLQSILMKPLSDRNVIVETATEQVTRQDLISIREQRNKDKEETTSSATLHLDQLDGDLLDVELLLAPVSGIPINELTKGDKIMVRIKAQTTKGRYYIDSFGVRIDGTVLPVPAEVIDVQKGEEKEYVILSKLEEGVFGKAIEKEQVKLKKYDELLSPHISLEDFHDINKPDKKSTFPVFIAVTGGLMFIVLIIVVVLWFNNYL
jgi:hypothetical protein